MPGLYMHSFTRQGRHEADCGQSIRVHVRSITGDKRPLNTRAQVVRAKAHAEWHVVRKQKLERRS